MEVGERQENVDLEEKVKVLAEKTKIMDKEMKKLKNKFAESEGKAVLWEDMREEMRSDSKSECKKDKEEVEIAEEKKNGSKKRKTHQGNVEEAERKHVSNKTRLELEGQYEARLYDCGSGRILRMVNGRNGKSR